MDGESQLWVRIATPKRTAAAQATPKPPRRITDPSGYEESPSLEERAKPSRVTMPAASAPPTTETTGEDERPTNTPTSKPRPTPANNCPNIFMQVIPRRRVYTSSRGDRHVSVSDQ